MNIMIKPLLLAAVSVLVVACNSDGNSTPAVTATAMKYQVTVTNITAGQPFSPPVLVLHGEGYHAFEEGKGASVGLEMIAESGRNAEFASDAVSRGLTVMADATTPILPGHSRSYTLETAKPVENRLSMAAMLGKTNDGFTGVDNLMLNLAAGESMTIMLPAWDAGTEANTETMATLGALGGEGFNPMRDDSPGVVTIHPGVLGHLQNPASDLSELQRFDNPVMQLTITRL